MRYSFFTFLAAITFLVSCKKSYDTSQELLVDSISRGQPAKSKSILIDASRDGGVWWFPQSNITGFSASTDRQGKKLADYLKSLGYEVDELPRNTVITSNILSKYSYVIRAGGFGNYTSDEILAYRSFLTGSKSLLLLQDHLQNFSNDHLSAQLGLDFEGDYTATIRSFAAHNVTIGVTSLQYLAGSVILNPDPSKIVPIGTMRVFANGTTHTAAAMGILIHPTSRIFFMGDINGLEAVPQPFTSNLINWLFK